MSPIAQSARVAACALAAAVLPALAAAQPVGVERRSAVDVRVTNTPLPVTGRLSIGNTAANPLYIRDVDGPARQPFSFFGNCESTSSNICQIRVPAIPAGKRLVLQHVNGAVQVFGTTRILNYNVFVGNGALAMPATVVSADGSTSNYAINEPVLAYLEPGAELIVQPSASDTRLIATTRLSGYFVDLN